MLNRHSIFLILMAALVGIPITEADPNGRDSQDKGHSRSSWTWVDNCHVLRPHDLTDFGTHYSLLATYQLQSILSGAGLEGKTRGDFTYITTIEQDLWRGGSLIVYGEGGKGKGIDPLLNSFLSTNTTIEEADIYVSRFFLLDDLLPGRLQVLAGKVAMSDFFDTSAVANCETREFLAGPLVNNPTIPFPDFGLGAAVKIYPLQRIYLQAGLADAKARGTTTGLESAFGQELKLFRIMELGLPADFDGRKGTYRFMYWHSPVSQSASGEFARQGSDGWALSFDQQIEDALTIFTRYGYAARPVADVQHFWSAGGRFNGVWSGVRDDFLEVAAGLGISPDRHVRDNETLIEMNYSAQINESLAITPLVQIIRGLPDDKRSTSAVIAGFRVVWAF